MAIETTTFKSALDVQHDAAQQRVADRTGERQHRIATLKEKGGVAKADDPERVASRIDRLSHYYPDIRPVNPASIVANDPEAMAAAGAVLERVINTEDFVGVRYLETGVVASHAVGRVDIYDQA